ncbi:adult-specific cuticular protein ACP-20-like [Sabethes cyaneus]|uniref:adult-specific cuticular protein ACP-20-like n=1 Tax=Sabethes cyaneus TaxID=53552 RepID=UPI00237DD044|nr:adult-specific cuticular protein ACP-20-like [Sabethes cyaneus]
MIKFSVVTLALLGVALASNYNGIGAGLIGGYGGGLVRGIGPVYGGLGLGGRWIGNGLGGAVIGGYGPGSSVYGPDYYSYPRYNYEYGVKDYLTGDNKGQWEVRDGDVVKGEYTLDEADGTKRIVQYYADDTNGFTANVKNVGQGGILGMLGGGVLGGLGGGHLGGYSYSNVNKYL